MNSLKALEEKLSQFLDRSESVSLEGFLPNLLRYHGNDWQKHTQFKEERYCRVQIEENDRFEIVLICWLPNQETPLHNHPKQGCVMKIMEGALEENRILTDGDKLTRQLEAGDSCFMHDDIGKHIIANRSNAKAISLHLYAPGFFEPNA